MFEIPNQFKGALVGIVVWSTKVEKFYRIGISFLKIRMEDKELINKIIRYTFYGN